MPRKIYSLRHPKCMTCRAEYASWAWQPFGPGETPLTFSLLGSHYRGFTVVKVCDACKKKIENDVAVYFTVDRHYYCGKASTGFTTLMNDLVAPQGQPHLA